MFGSYSRAVITDRDLEVRRAFGKRDFNGTILRSKTQRVVDQIAHSALEQGGVGRNLSLAFATDPDMAIFCDRFIKRRNFLRCRARVESLPRDRLACNISPRKEKQVVYDSGE